MVRTKKTFDSEFELYLKGNYPEHARRILLSRSNASLVSFFYPLLSFLIPVVFFAGIALVVAFFRVEIIANFQSGKFADFINHAFIQNVIIGICAVGLFSAFISFIIGLLLGLSKSRELIFQSEQLETGIRHIWLTENVFNLNSNKNNSINNEEKK